MTVETAPRYIRVRPGWLEKLLLVSVLCQILLTAYLLLFGSGTARDSLRVSEGNRALLCERIWDVSPQIYHKYLQYCPPRSE